jgi:hypothetical protein
MKGEEMDLTPENKTTIDAKKGEDMGLGTYPPEKPEKPEKLKKPRASSAQLPKLRAEIETLRKELAAQQERERGQEILFVHIDAAINETLGDIDTMQRRLRALRQTLPPTVAIPGTYARLSRDELNALYNAHRANPPRDPNVRLYEEQEEKVVTA